MKSKKFYFNKTIFNKNVALFWPLGLMYFFAMLYLFPVRISYLISNYLDGMSAEAKRTYKLTVIDQIVIETDFSMHIFIVFGTAILLAMAMFSYIHNAKSSYMIHSMPVTRGELYITNMICGFMFLMIPLFVSFILSVFVCMSYGIANVGTLGLLFLEIFVFAILEYSIAVMCNMITGQLFVAPVYYVISNMLVVGILWIFVMMVEIIPYGQMYSIDNILMDKISWLSPIYYVSRNNFFLFSDWSGNESVRYDISYFIYMISYLVIANILYIMAYKIYKNRKLEDAGSMLTIRWLKPVFRCGFGFCFGCIATYCFNSMLKENDIYYKIPFAFVLAALWIFVMISVVIAEMIVRKEFKIVSKRIIYESFGFSSVVLIAMAGLIVFSDNYMKSVPDASDVKSATVTYNYTIKYMDEDGIDKARELQKKLCDCMEFSEREYECVTIVYDYKNGEKEQRRYYVDELGLPDDVSSMIKAEENGKDNFLNSMFGIDYKNNLLAEEGEIQIQNDYGEIDYINISGEETKKLVEAIEKDADDEKIQECYSNRYDYWRNGDEYYVGENICSMYLTFSYESSEKIEHCSTYETTSDDVTFEVNYDSTCKNIVKEVAKIQKEHKKEAD